LTPPPLFRENYLLTNSFNHKFLKSGGGLTIIIPFLKLKIVFIVLEFLSVGNGHYFYERYKL